MLQGRYRLAAALVAVVLFAQPLGSPDASTSPPDTAHPAPLRAELGIAASIGAGPLPGILSSLPNRALTPPPVPEKDRLIFIDPGHGGKDVGAIHTAAGGEVDVTEAAANLSIALKLADQLRNVGYDAALSRSTDSFVIPGAGDAVELQKRVDMANEAGADLYIAVHNNGFEDPAVQGTEVWYCGDREFGEQSARLAGLVQQALVRNLREAGYETQDRGAKDDRPMGHFAVIGPHIARPSQMPGIIGESLFLTNDQDAAALKEDSIQEAIARGYSEGITAYLEDRP